MAFSCKNIKEINFFSGGREVSPGQIFSETYGKLNDLIRYNISHNGVVSKVGKTEHYASEQMARDLAQSASQAFDDEIRNPSFSAVAALTNGSKYKFSIRPRTNYDSSLTKFPNILHLVNEDLKDPIVLREGRTYQDEPQIKKRVDNIGSRDFHRHYRGSIENSGQQSQHTTDVFLVPEPKLVLGLEQMYTEKLANRITPEIKVCAVGENRVWYLRDFLPSAGQVSLDQQSLVRYFGTLHGLGLMDNADFDPEHYCINDGETVNIDPDFMFFTKSRKIIDFDRWDKLKSPLEWKWGTMLTRGYFDFHEAKTQRKTMIEELEKRLKGKSLFDYLPQNIKEAPALKSSALENVIFE